MISEEMCTTIKTLFEKGYNISQIARMLNIDRKTVRKKLNESNKPLKEKTRVSILDPYKEYIEIEAQKGIQAKRIFHDLIRDYGYSGSYDTVKKSDPRTVIIQLIENIYLNKKIFWKI